MAALFVEFNSQVQNSKNTDLDSISRFEKKMVSFRCFLDLLSDRDNFGYNTFEEYYPGLRQKIDRLNVSPDKLVKTRVSNVQAMDTKLPTCIPVKSEKVLRLRTYSKGLHAANSNTVEYA